MQQVNPREETTRNESQIEHGGVDAPNPPEFIESIESIESLSAQVRQLRAALGEQQELVARFAALLEDQPQPASSTTIGTFAAVEAPPSPNRANARRKSRGSQDGRGSNAPATRRALLKGAGAAAGAATDAIIDLFAIIA